MTASLFYICQKLLIKKVFIFKSKAILFPGITIQNIMFSDKVSCDNHHMMSVVECFITKPSPHILNPRSQLSDSRLFCPFY